MRHQKNKITLDRKTGPRGHLLAGLAESLILHEKINTTKAKGKAVRSMVERLITKARDNSVTSRRRLLAVLYTRNAANKLIEVLGPRYAKRNGGYTRTVVVRNRVGDNAEEVLIELV
jgi:large subunit ribosomal protein L17